MSRFAAATALVVLALQSVSAGAATPPPSPPPQEQPQRKRLDLGLFGSPYGTPLHDATQDLHFESWVEVIGEPKPDPNEAMAVWMKHFGLVEPAVYGRGYNLRPDAHPNAINLVPLLQKAYEKIRKR